MIRELRKEAKKFISETGYGTGSNFTTGQVATLMARFAADAINKNAVLRDVSNNEVACCGNCHLPLDNIEIVPKVQIADKKYNP